MSSAPRLSVILATHNRRDVVRHTLERVLDGAAEAGAFEVIVVDNASDDGTPDAVCGFPRVRLLRLHENRGSCAKARGVDVARGKAILFLDDDSYPRPGAVRAMLRAFEADPRLAAAGFTVHLPDGSQECSALPHVFVGCGVGLRAAALSEVGGLDATFFMQAEEYDLSFRLLRAGWRVETSADLAVEHLKSPHARRSARTAFYDVRNNLRLVARYFPALVAREYWRDWRRRYRWLARLSGHGRAHRRGLAAARALAPRERRAYRRWRLDPATLESVLAWGRVEHEMRRLSASGLRRVVFADLGKNVFAYWRAAHHCGVDILAIADDRFAGARAYRGTPIVSTSDALRLAADAWVVGNMSYVHAARRAAELRRTLRVPSFNWFPPPGGPNACPAAAGMGMLS